MPGSWQEIRTAFERALALEEAAQVAYLQELREQDPELADEVETLLAADRQSEAVFEDLSKEVSGLDESLAPAPPPLPERLGGFAIEGILGQGGMGVVYRGRDETLDRPVAIKLLPPAHRDNEQSIAQLHREARLVAALNHPGIATIHSFEATTEGTNFLVMELVPGESLRERLRRGPLPREEALRIGRQIAEALDAAHDLGIVHRDLKPDNVMVTPQGRVKILDFGIATYMESTERGEQPAGRAEAKGDLPQTLGRIGTPGYMSPEQIHGGVIDGQSDVFGVGCVLFECLAGRPAFPGHDPDERLAKTERADIDWSLIPDEPALRELLHDCLRPDRETRTAEATAVVQRLGEVLAGSRAEDRGTNLPPHNLPRERTPFIGRRSNLEVLDRALQQDRLVTLTGFGGSGKTRLALALARRRRPQSPDGTWWVDLSMIRSGARVAHVLAEAVGATDAPEGEVHTLVGVLGRLGGHQATVVFDNCEHVLADVAETVERLLNACPAVTIIATSRAPLGLEGEQTYPVPMLDLPSLPPESDPNRSGEEFGDLETVRASESGRLFLEHAQRHRADFALTEHNAREVIEICRRLEGIPLAIELAAARVRLLSPSQILSLLGDRFRLLTGGAAGHPRQKTLHDAIAWSYELLDETERRLFRTLSIFAGGWTLNSAAAVTQTEEFELLDGLTQLANASLVEVGQGKDGEPRYRFLETTRQFATTLLRDAGELDRVTGRHFDLFYRIAEEAQRGLNGPQHGRWSLRLEAEHDNILAALHAPAADAEAEQRLLQLGGFLILFWMGTGYLSEARSALVSILERTTVRSPARAVTLKALAAVEHGRGDLQAARDWAQEALSVAEETGNELDLASALHGTAVVEAEFHNDDRAIELFERALRIFTEAGDERGQGSTELNLGLLARRKGDRERAVQHMERSVHLLRKNGNLQTLTNTLGNLASSLMDLGREREAMTHLHEGLLTARTHRLHADGANLMLLASHWAAEASDWVRSAWYLGVAESIWKMMGAQPTPGEQLTVEEVGHLLETAGEPAAEIAAARERGAGADFDRALAEACDWFGASR